LDRDVVVRWDTMARAIIGAEREPIGIYRAAQASRTADIDQFVEAVVDDVVLNRDVAAGRARRVRAFMSRVSGRSNQDQRAAGDGRSRRDVGVLDDPVVAANRDPLVPAELDEHNPVDRHLTALDPVLIRDLTPEIATGRAGVGRPVWCRVIRVPEAL